MKIDRNYMKVIIHKLLEDIKAKELDYGINGAKAQILLGYDEAQVLLDALESEAESETQESELENPLGDSRFGG